jgi:lipoprotein NlpD
MQRLRTLGLFFIFCMVFSLLAGCFESTELAPVVELHWRGKTSSRASHTVHQGDTLYSIAFRYDKDYRLLADYNQLRPPYTLKIGQIIYLQYLRKIPNRYYAPVKSLSTAKKQYQPYSNRPYANRPYANRPYLNKPYSSSKPVIIRPIKTISQSKIIRSNIVLRNGNTWHLPAQGTVVQSFLPSQGKKGIDIAGKKGEPIYAARAGIIAYAGNGIKGYGNLIIIKHEGQFLTAYGNNLKNFVHEGQKVKVGQKIAEMGRLDGKYWGVHFEIRKAGQPVNPAGYLH